MIITQLTEDFLINSLSISEVPSKARNLGEGVARTRYALLGEVSCETSMDVSPKPVETSNQLWLLFIVDISVYYTDSQILKH